MQTRARSRSRSRRPVESRSCIKCPGCNNDARQPVSGSSNGTDEKRRKRSHSVANTPRHRTRSRSRGRQTFSPPPTPMAVPTNQSMNSDHQAPSTSTNAAPVPETTRASHETMKIDTRNYCLFCFKLCNHAVSRGDGVEEADAARRKEVCSRYLKLLTRHLDLDIYSHVATTSDLDNSFFSKTIKKDKGYFDIVACNACYSLCESFCDAHHKYQQAQLEIGWNVMKMKDIMKSAEKVPSRINDFRRNVLEADGGMKKQEKELMDGFRREFYRKCNRVKGYPKLVLKKHSGKIASAIQRRTTVGLRRFHQSTPIDMIRNPTASVEVLELGDELILTSRARAPRSKSVPPIPLITPSALTFETLASPQVAVRKTPQQAPSNQNQSKMTPVISKPAQVKTKPKKSNPSEETPGPSSSIRSNVPNKKSTKVIHIAKRVPAPSPQKCIAVVDLCDSDEENDSESGKASPPKKSKTATTASVVVEPVVPEAPPLPNSGESSSNMEAEVNVDDNTGKDTGTALAANQDDNDIVMEISSQPAPQPSEASTSHTSTSLRQTPEILANPSTSYYFNPQSSGSSSTSANSRIIPNQMDSQPNTDAFTNEYPYYSPHSQTQYEVPQNTQYDSDYTDAPPEATGTFTQHEPYPQPMDFEFPSPAPGTGIEFTVDPVSNGPEMCRISYTYTRTVTSTFSGIPPENFGMPHSHMYTPHTTSQEQPPFYNTTQDQDHGYDPQYNSNDYIPEQFNSTAENYYAPHETVDPQPIVTEVEEENNYANNLNEDEPLNVGFVAIAEVDDDSNDVQVIQEVGSGTQRDFTVTMNLRNESEANMENNGMCNNMETNTPPVYVCT